jgi:hypothetical protein
MTAEFICAMIVAILAVFGLVFNSGVLYNDVKHLKKSVDDIWSEINEIKNILIERSKE